ncbi:hypothetical protein O181_053095 [Austropuccinia psidii MF-1]|uniref:Uncharacterized protein n=1 Tax=Austropuccinia psidii MF-1 TaxID=1389203 RepID=A0A9Q3E675_9BASI|nr:hypothetical protein [Austropuccinia psidii MF-1]
MSHQPIKPPQKSTSTLPLVPLTKTGFIIPNNPSSLAHQNLPAPKLSSSSYFDNNPHISQTYSLNLSQFKHLPTGAAQQEYPTHPNLPNL